MSKPHTNELFGAMDHVQKSGIKCLTSTHGWYKRPSHDEITL